ncbi:MAG TPA: hypothetical protein VFV61_02895, partial [Pyrinomonadaceae bacterium]|nr:hypothetical protein [Pyrinomonadaceae bacterium]
MRTTFQFIVSPLVLLVALSVSLSAQEKEKKEPQFKLVEFHMALLKLGPNGNATNSEQAKAVHDEQQAYFQELVKSGKAV